MAASELEDERLDPGRARELIATEGAQALDLRPLDEYAEAHIAGSVHAEEDEVDEALESLSKDQPVVVIGADDERSASVASDLRERGFQAAILQGGMQAWSGESLPTQPREGEEFEGPRRAGPLGQ
jgi:rhodanese-related sulfurtransferase